MASNPLVKTVREKNRAGKEKRNTGGRALAGSGVTNAPVAKYRRSFLSTPSEQRDSHSQYSYSHTTGSTYARHLRNLNEFFLYSVVF